MYIMSLKVSKALMRVGTKRGGDRGLAYSLTRLSVAVNNVLHQCVIRLSSVLLAAQTRCRSESAKPECRVNSTFRELSYERAIFINHLSRITER